MNCTSCNAIHSVYVCVLVYCESIKVPKSLKEQTAHTFTWQREKVNSGDGKLEKKSDGSSMAVQ